MSVALFCRHVCLCTACLESFGDQERVPVPWGLEFWVVWSHSVVVESGAQVFWKSSRCP